MAVYNVSFFIYYPAVRTGSGNTLFFFFWWSLAPETRFMLGQTDTGALFWTWPILGTNKNV